MRVPIVEAYTVEIVYVKDVKIFQKRYVGLCRSTGFKVINCQSWRVILSCEN